MESLKGELAVRSPASHECAWHRSRTHHSPILLIAMVLAWSTLANAQHWTPVTMPFPGNATTALVLTDGNVRADPHAGD